MNNPLLTNDTCPLANNTCPVNGAPEATTAQTVADFVAQNVYGLAGIAGTLFAFAAVKGAAYARRTAKEARAAVVAEETQDQAPAVEQAEEAVKTVAEPIVEQAAQVVATPVVATPVVATPAANKSGNTKFVSTAKKRTSRYNI